ncbi:unnamed protein product [Hymenolepis diminuta]|uniref:small monomeric GTPase n=1 Tax=Hymenolepis diminuta TaxID=6216 RepID=A0A0R3SWC8_HYMDI|nr:unnamed protein product [Hymenolepis diminuta]VUZ42755.1 unnamed protein product [Hymenolepis diminuta]
MNFLNDWVFSPFSKVLNMLGLYQKSGKLVFLGLDNAGKTTLLHRLKDDRYGTHNPTLHATSEELTIAGMKFTTYDLGGHEQARKVWQSFVPAVDGVVFIVDASEEARFDEAKIELDSLIMNQDIANAPILVLGNKIDIPSAVSEAYLRSRLGLDGQVTGKGTVSRDAIASGRPIEIFMCSILKRQGYGDAFKWLAQYLD